MLFFKKKPKSWAIPKGNYYNLYADMLGQPHLLIAGKTGSGKSVAENGIICTALYKEPCQVQFVFLDTKKVELSPYRNIPHCLIYADEIKLCEDALQKVCDIMDQRYRQMQTQGIRKYEGSDIWVVIDEMADLMLTSKASKKLIQRISQVGRAARVHLLCCTQTPIAKVIPTEIKCNIDSRLGLRTRSAQDSRNIIGMSGLELLPEYGSGYYMTSRSQDEGRWEIPMIPDDEQNRLIKWWESQK